MVTKVSLHYDEEAMEAEEFGATPMVSCHGNQSQSLLWQGSDGSRGIWCYTHGKLPWKP